jgi:acyl-CoA hydrolase
MSLMDMAGGAAAFEFAGGRVVTAGGKDKPPMALAESGT